MRLVSLIPSTTELIFDLGAGQDLVGITDWCIHPAAGVASIEKVGGTKNPNIERIAELKPDWVFLNEEENRIEDSRALEALGLRLHHSFPKTVAQSIDMIRSVGSAIEREQAAQDLADRSQAEMERLQQLAAGEKPISYAYLIWRKPWMVAGGDTYLTDLLGLVGGVNVFADHPDRYPTIDLEALRARKPDVLLLCSEPFPFQQKHVLEIQSFSGLEAQMCCLADGEALTWHGSRTLSGMSYAWDLLRGSRHL